MFKKEKTDEEPAETTQVEETAYEDSWYRSLKALSQRPVEETEDEESGAAED
jgi:hypothetical protein